MFQCFIQDLTTQSTIEQQLARGHLVNFAVLMAWHRKRTKPSETVLLLMLVCYNKNDGKIYNSFFA